MKLRVAGLALLMAGAAWAADSATVSAQKKATQQKAVAAESAKVAADKAAQAKKDAGIAAKEKAETQKTLAAKERAAATQHFAFTVTAEQVQKGVRIKYWGVFDANANAVCNADTSSHENDRGDLRLNFLTGSGDLPQPVAYWGEKSFPQGPAKTALKDMTARDLDLSKYIKDAGDYRLAFQWTHGVHRLMLGRVGIAIGKAPADDAGWQTLESGAAPAPVIPPVAPPKAAVPASTASPPPAAH